MLTPLALYFVGGYKINEYRNLYAITFFHTSISHDKSVILIATTVVIMV